MKMLAMAVTTSIVLGAGVLGAAAPAVAQYYDGGYRSWWGGPRYQVYRDRYYYYRPYYRRHYYRDWWGGHRRYRSWWGGRY